jgi:hypothetical protein
MPTEYRFDDLDLYEEPARGESSELVPYTDQPITNIHCTMECCSYTCTAYGRF